MAVSKNAPRSNRDNKTLVIIILAALLVLSVCYILYGMYQQQKTMEFYQYAQSGYEQGVIDTVTSLLVKTDNCNFANVTFGNASRLVVDVGCIKVSNSTVQ